MKLTMEAGFPTASHCVNIGDSVGEIGMER
jgi:hypothetical protein